MKASYLFILLLYLPLSCNSAQQGDTGPQADRDEGSGIDPAPQEDRELRTTDDPAQQAGEPSFQAAGKENNSGSTIPAVKPAWSEELNEKLRESSGLLLWDGALWTMNDDTDTRLYGLDTASGEIISTYLLPGVVNRDWEDLAQDEHFIYVGDFGNNRGTRKDLRILRIDKAGLKSGRPSIDRIWFRFSDQQKFAAAGLNQTEFDCEAFVVSRDSIYLFTKQWLTGNTSQYVLPKLPGRYVAHKRAVFNIRGQVTGATFLEEERLLVLCGYTGMVQPFLTLFHDYPGDDFFSGKHETVHIAIPFHQVEALATLNGMKYYLTNERTVVEPYVNLPPKLHQVDLSGLIPDSMKHPENFD